MRSGRNERPLRTDFTASFGTFSDHPSTLVFVAHCNVCDKKTTIFCREGIGANCTGGGMAAFLPPRKHFR